ncbi:SusC/RagA family TonB-linked outer membrane protein [Pontibacter chitinilyticus]|uniref:SusC/RagA family TonB-linked outer membrane protein n=1 Tax=Pontibacter chitinilyticus TaxID=2674989 RepID=UPI00321B6663
MKPFFLRRSKYQRISSLCVGFTFLSLTLAAQQAPSDTVTIGYCERSTVHVAAAQTTLAASAFNVGMITTTSQLLTGKLVGLLITPTGGAPGAADRMLFRQGVSLQNVSTPLVVLDGIPLDSHGILGADDPYSFLNPEDIATVTLLKDAAAAAIYGSRGTAGVLLITTKKGQVGKQLHVSFSTMGALSLVPETAAVLSADAFRARVHQYGSEAQQALLGEANTEWQAAIYHKAISTRQNLSLQGGLGALPYRLSLGYLNQNGILKTSGFSRASAALILSPSLLKEHLKLVLDLRSARLHTSFGDRNAIAGAVRFDPTQPLKAQNAYGGYFTYLAPDGKPNPWAPANPLSLLEQQQDDGISNRNLANLTARYTFPFLHDLQATVHGAYDHAANARTFSAAAAMARYADKGGRQYTNEQTLDSRLLEFYLNYGHSFSSLNGRVDFTLGASEQKFEQENNYGPTRDAQGNMLDSSTGYNSSESRLKAYFARVNYTYANQLELNGTLRRDASPLFATDNRWFLSRALGVAWHMQKDGTDTETPPFPQLTWRASYGVTGYADVPLVQPLNTYGGGVSSFMANPDLTYEKVRSFNLGLNAGLLHNRLKATADFYSRTAKDLFLLMSLHSGTMNYVYLNSGSYRSSGLELYLRFKVLQKESLTWQLGLNGTYNRNKVRDLGEHEAAFTAGQIVGDWGGYIQTVKPGYPSGSFYTYQQVYGPDGKPQEGVYTDRDQDMTVTHEDRYTTKVATPKVYVGLSSELAYKRLNVSFLLRGQAGNHTYNNTAAASGSYISMLNSNSYLFNASASIQETNFRSPQFFSDYYIERAAFLRMDYLSLGYTFGSSKTSLRATATLQNAFLLTRYSGQSPEIAGGLDGYSYPLPRTFSLGLQLTR